MTDRRTLLAGMPIALGATALMTVGCEKTNEDPLDPFSEARGFIGEADDKIFLPEASQRQVVGTGASRHAEVRDGFKLLWDAPRTQNHMEIAEYFLNITKKNQNERNAAGEIASYNEEWVSRANPLITSFFGMTNTLPSRGDQTAWCAAFVSFILYAAGKPNKFSALSGAYRSYGKPTEEPKFGDVVVFRKNGEKGDLGFGHVGFYISDTPDKVRVLGGNQRAGEGSTGAVVISEYLKKGASLSLHSFRSVPT